MILCCTNKHTEGNTILYNVDTWIPQREIDLNYGNIKIDQEKYHEKKNLLLT